VRLLRLTAAAEHVVSFTEEAHSRRLNMPSAENEII